MVYLATFILAACSIIYELLLGQTLSAFLGNTVLRYSVTVGLYMFSMGIGALFAEGRVKRYPLPSIVLVEMGLTLVGGFSVVMLFWISSLGVPTSLVSVCAHLLIVLVGILTGLEIPLMIYLKNIERPGSDNRVLGVDYAGAFLGTILFATWLYPSLGLVPSAFLVGSLNGVVGVFFGVRWVRSRTAPVESARGRILGLAAQLAVVVLVLSCLYHASSINREFLSHYLDTYATDYATEVS